jgi:hypothetical protein
MKTNFSKSNFNRRKDTVILRMKWIMAHLSLLDRKLIQVKVKVKKVKKIKMLLMLMLNL